MNTRHKILASLIGGLALLGLGRTGYAAYEAQVSTNIPASATIGAITSLGAQARNISNNQPAPSVSFGAVTGLQLAAQYVRIDFRSNLVAWGLSIYSNNTGAAEELRRFRDPQGRLVGRAGGLLHTSTNTVVLPVGWQAHNDVQSTPPTPGDPATPASGWRFMKDRNDADWTTVGGFRNVAFGGSDFANIIPPQGDPIPNRTGFFHTYPEAVGPRAVGSYSGIVGFDIYTE